VTAVVVVAHHERADAASISREAIEWLRAQGHEAWMIAGDAAALGLADLGDDRSPGEADLALSVGGDGTILRTVASLDGAPVPVIGVNAGVLGYLAELEAPALLPSLQRWLADTNGEPAPPTARPDSARIEERMMLQLEVRRATGGLGGTWRALNELVLEKVGSGHTISLQVHIDGAPFTSYAADGLIVATPTGSTAYSLSARGPVVSPEHRAMLLTPVSPHMLFDRSLVLGPDETICIEVAGYRAVAVAVDGQTVATLEHGDCVECVAASATARFVRFGRRRFHQILKAKFGLTDR
jgi:NAD+ kinase